ncbi:hypothetical protein QTH87_04310 [Variovorax sp. J22P168]|uniref:hypothetical protein n=1 Tax=Variovorax jilinensis TaxID=3053513 RepID=UPI0025754190|nr:hypothetical protein [Variovorax sp. J22P168]MDM0011658.1 hypothetical protein [Variovorax sp. J22P168]
MTSLEALSAKAGLLAASAAVALLGLVPLEAGAVACAKGVYRAGCVGPNGAAVVARPPPPPPPVYRGGVKCVDGVYRAGCAGPRGAAVVRK